MSTPLERLAALSPAQRALVEAKLRERLRGGGDPRVPPRADRAAWPLSFAQERLWFVEQLLPGSAANHISAAVRVSGPLRVDALAGALTDLVTRHEVLRTVYRDEHGTPVGAVLPPVPLDVPLVDVPAGDDQGRLAAARHLASLEAARVFDLSRDVMVRLSLLRLAADDHVLVIVLHHIAADGWSVGVMAGELAACYEARLDGSTAPLPALPVQYADYAAWLRARAAGDRLEQQLDWWRTQLAGLEPFELPTDFPRPATPPSHGAREALAFPPALAEAVAVTSQRLGVTPFITLLTAFQVLLGRWAGRPDVAVGSPVAGRPVTDVEGLVGLFVNTLVLRTHLGGHPTFERLVADVRERVADALGHQDVPFDRLVDALQVERTLVQAPLTPVVFALQNLPASMTLAGVRTSTFEIDRTTARFDVCLFVVETPDGLQASVEYRTDLFRAATMNRLLRGYLQLLQAALAQPSLHIDELPIVTDDERHRLLGEWNQTQRALPVSTTIHALVSDACRRTPSAVAVVCGAETLTYGGLHERAQAIGQALHALGVRAGHRVGVCLERSIDLVAALVGILEAGAAYVALDPMNPPARLAGMAADAGLSVIVTAGPLREAVAACQARLLELDAPLPSVDVPGWMDREPARPDDLAYISFTSGSTGVPKGVEVPHRAVLRLLHGVDYAAFGADETFLMLAPLAFDASTFEIWGALVHGGRLAVYPQRVPEFDELRRVLAEQRVTTLWLTASLFNAVIDTAPDMLSGVRQVLAGGEALSVAHVRKAVQQLPHTSFVNGYGPTEATTFTCCHRITPADVADGCRAIPIGRPIGNTRVYVVDSGMALVPVGCPGELLVGDLALARGYARAPRLTAERFVPDPFGSAPGARLYRTGDIVRYRDDGVLEYLGRRDGQVKIRGYRIEPGEIEAALRACAGVREAAARVWQDEHQRKTIVAYVVAEPGDGDPPLFDVEAVRAALRARLPDYMVPSAIVELDSLPRTVNGKVDRDALPPPLPAAADGAFVEPRNEVEAVVIETCRELLGLSRVSVLDNFFEAGGHSLLATQFAARLRRAFDIEIGVRAVFEAGTLAELSDGIVRRLLEDE